MSTSSEYTAPVLAVGCVALTALLYFVAGGRQKLGRLAVHSVTTGMWGEEVRTVRRVGVPISDEEDQAMLFAMLSRTLSSLEELCERVFARGSSNFMQIYYNGYGDKSIADCGHASLEFDNVSFIAAKAIEDSPLFRGIETSTRYVDFSRRLLPSTSQNSRRNEGR